MIRTASCIAAFCVLSLSPGLLGAGEPPRGSLERLSWLSGCWASLDGERGSEEIWTSPAGGTLFGISRTVREGRTVAWELLQIRQEPDGDIVLVARPSNQPEASFRLIDQDAFRVVFENPDHDFPQRVLYTRDAEGRLIGRIEGVSRGRERAVDFPMNPVACPTQGRIEKAGPP